MLKIIRPSVPMDAQGEINRLKVSENDTEAALVELAELAAAQDDALVEIAEMIAE